MLPAAYIENGIIGAVAMNRTPGIDNNREEEDVLQDEVDEAVQQEFLGGVFIENNPPDEVTDPVEEIWKDYTVQPAPNTSTRHSSSSSSPRFEDGVPSKGRYTYAGAQNIPAGVNFCSSYLKLFFTHEVLQTFVDDTNSYVSKQAKPVWSAENCLTLLELKRFLGGWSVCFSRNRYPHHSASVQCMYGWD